MKEPLPKVARQVKLDASPHQVWAYLVNGELATLWMGGAMTIDARRGGRVSLHPAGGPEVFGTVEEIIPGRRIVWSWRTKEGEPTQVVLEMEEAGLGCLLAVSEELIPYEIVVIPPVVA